MTWLVPPMESALAHQEDETIDAGLNLDHSLSDETIADVSHSQLSANGLASAPRDSETRRLDSDTGISLGSLAGDQDGPPTSNFFDQPVPPMPKLSAPTEHGIEQERSGLGSESVSKGRRPNLGGLAPGQFWLAVAVSALVGGLLAWILTS